jgi:cell pole-organizing protein PopZ
MADTSTPPATGSEPSMEEILASIRKIITDENAPPSVEDAAPAADDVIELTQMVQDDGSVVDVTAAPEPESVVEIPPPEPVKMAEVTPPPAPPDPLVEEPVVSAAAHSFSSLANTVEIERLASNPVSMTFMGNGSRTLEDMVIELMRPLLKDWLDKNLPPTVDRLVQKEIERISRKV